jgi:hypothetical protein
MTGIAVDYTQYISQVSEFRQVTGLQDNETTFLFKLANSLGLGYKITSYLRLKGQLTAHRNEQIIAKRLEEKDLVEVTEAKFFSGGTQYMLTQAGLFYVLSKLEGYSPNLLIKYADSILLKTLIYQYFETDTIKRSTARLYAEITRYVRECCQITISRVQVIKTSMRQEYIEAYTKELEFELIWLAKLLVLKVAIMYNEANILRTTGDITKDNARVALYELENDMKTLLSRDTKFKSILESTFVELEEGYQEIQKRFTKQ